MISNQPRRPSAQMMSALDAVRRATAESHRSLEALPTQARLLRDDYSTAEYEGMLLRLYGLYDALAGALAAAAGSPGNGSAAAFGRRIAGRAALLCSDLLELDFDAADLAAAPRCTTLPPLDTSDRVLGCAYVFEGSTLGGRVIFTHLTRVFAGAGAPALRFFTGDGDATGPNWREFCRELDADADDVEALCSAAVATFGCIAGWLESISAHRKSVA